MDGLYHTEDHEWILVEGDVGAVGITDHAQEQLGDIVFFEMTKTDGEVARGADVAVIESVKAASDIYSPVSGTVIAVNAALGDEPATVNSDAMGAGWMFKIKLSDPGELEGLMSEEAYRAYLETL